MTEFGLPLAEFVNESSDLFNVYTGFFGISKQLIGYLLLLGSVVLPITFPFMAGLYIREAKEYYNDKSESEAGFNNTQ